MERATVGYQIDHMKDTYVQYESRKKKAEHLLAWPQLVACIFVGWLKFFATLRTSTNDMKVLGTLIWGLHLHPSKSENLETRNLWIHCPFSSFLSFTRV